jgi:hypothetical protein
MTKATRYFLILIPFFLYVSCSGSTTPVDPDTEDWVELFNGENFDGWDFKIRGYELNYNYNNTFRVEDGLMKVRYDEYEEFNGQFGHIYYNEPFSHYRLQVEYRFVGEQAPNGPGWAFRNNGIMFHSQSAESVELDQDFPNSIEFQLLGGDGDNDRPNGSICTPGTHVVVGGELKTQHCISSNGPTHHGDQWVTAELVAFGNALIRHKLNDEVVIEYTNPHLDDGTPLTGGYFALQAESHPTDIRSVRILNLEGCMDENARNYKSYFVKDNPDACVYN